MAPKARDLNPSGLGRAIINRKAKDARKIHDSGLYSVDTDPTSKLKSVTQERDLDEFLNNAQLAGTEFTAERRNVKVIQQSVSNSQNPYLLSEHEEKKVLKRHEENKGKLRVPRRPPWTKIMNTAELDKLEKAAFLEWRRGIAEMQEQENLLLTPFERNIEVWRQLWRVLERSHLLVQIVDARNPLRFRCEDLEKYVVDVEGNEGEAGTGKGKRKTMLLINKADLLTTSQRRQWADYFEQQNVQYAFYSAANAAALQQRQKDAAETLENGEMYSSGPPLLGDEALPLEAARSAVEKELGQNVTFSGKDQSYSRDEGDYEDEDEDEGTTDEAYFSAEDDEADSQDPRVKVLTVLELEELLIKAAPDLSEFSDAIGQLPSKLVVGLVGYPNVGKSSTINSLLGEKKVSVSSTPGKTKHFQTIHLSESIVLCDCPGLVFPQFATTKADLVCDGVLPIDQMREYTGPISLVVKRIPKEILEATYGLSIKARSVEEGGDGKITAENFLIAYAIARGYMRSGQGNPDEARAARYILKDYVNGKLLFCYPPPGIDEDKFNKQTHEIALHSVANKKRAPETRVGKHSDTYVPPEHILASNITGSILPALGQGQKSRAVDMDFFENTSLSSRPFTQGSMYTGKEFTRARLYPHQNAVSDDGTPLQSGQVPFVAQIINGKKHHKKPKKMKQRSGKGYD